MQAVEQKHPCVRGCTPPLSLSLSLSLSPIPTFIPLSSDLPTDNHNPFIFHLSISPLSLSFYLFVLLLKLSYSLSPASGLHFQSAQKHTCFCLECLFYFSHAWRTAGARRAGKNGKEEAKEEETTHRGCRTDSSFMRSAWYSGHGPAFRALVIHRVSRPVATDRCTRSESRDDEFYRARHFPCFKSIFGKEYTKVTSVLAAFWRSNCVADFCQHFDMKAFENDRTGRMWVHEGIFSWDLCVRTTLVSACIDLPPGEYWRWSYF